MYQLMFAIITPALIIGAIAERMKFTAIMLFIAIWMFVVYIPMAHMIWGVTGLMNGVWNGDAAIKAIDFAGGTVVHMTSGWSALVLCIILGKRLGFGKEKMSPHSMVLCMVGTGMLWVGWYGFNAGSALAADGVSANAFMTTTLAAATAGFVWGIMEKILKGQASILGICSGIVAGLVVITPACGFVDATGAMIIGVLAAIVPYIFVMYVKKCGWLRRCARYLRRPRCRRHAWCHPHRCSRHQSSQRQPHRGEYLRRDQRLGQAGCRRRTAWPTAHRSRHHTGDLDRRNRRHRLDREGGRRPPSKS